MSNIRIKVAGLSIGIRTLYDDSLLPFCGDYLTNQQPDFCVEITKDDIDDERQKSMEECKYEGIKYPDYSPPNLENTAIYRKIAQKLPFYDALVFHGSAVAVGDKAFLFTAKSGTGKTTHTNLWLKNIGGSYIVNGDKPILRIIDGRATVCGTPWMGKERLGKNICVPLAGLCVLNRGEKNTVQRISFSEAMSTLIGQSYRPPDSAGLIKTLEVIGKIGESVGLFKLFCNMDDEAALVAYREMCK